MKRVYLAIIGLFLCLGAAAQEGTRNFIDRPYFEITGYAKVEFAPDLIYIDITINESDTKNKVSVDELEQTLYRTLQGLGINLDKQLKVNTMSSEFRKRNNIQQSRNYQLLVYDAATASKVFNALDKAGISNMNVSKTDHSDLEKYRRQAKTESIKAARQNAEQMAQAIGQEIGKAIFIQDNNFYYRPVYNTVMAMGAKSRDMAEEAVAADLEFQRLSIENNVLVRFELK